MKRSRRFACKLPSPDVGIDFVNLNSMTKEFRNSIRLYAKYLAKYTEEAGTGFNADVIHELRTTFKQLRALLRWQKAGKEIYTAFKKIYDVAGKLRNIQVAKEILKKETDTPQAFKNQLIILLLHLKEEWSKVHQKKILKQLHKNIENQKITPSKHKKFFSERVKNIQHLLNMDAVTDEAIHDIRKMTKDMQYVLEWWKKQEKRSEKLITNISITQLKNIGKQIGEYNDKSILLSLLISYAKQEKEPPLMNEITPLIDKWKHMKDLQKEQLITSLNSISWQTG